ncbi:hypothetical protein [Maricurvus nonylphenolicus]|uniref:hypothetical protein n=1 Tax=Maricurvus nonylphenolicus TaxID=1008307 RepID=UPI0036F2706D
MQIQKLTAVGQVKALDLIITEYKGIPTPYFAEEVLNPGTDKEEVIVDSRYNKYFITSMAVNGKSWAKNTIVIPALKRDSIPMAVPVDPRNPALPRITNSMKANCIGEFSWEEYAPYYDEFGEHHDCTAERVVPWDLCKRIYQRMAIEASKSQ